jgi:hypothetical protein
MQFVILIYQGTTPLPKTEAWDRLPDDEKKRIYQDYEALNKTPGLTAGLPMGLPADATTVRVEGGRTETRGGPFVDARGAVGGYFVLEAESLDAAVAVASRIPAARLGGAVEIRPVAKYW